MILSELPREIVNKIAKLLYFDDLATCTLVCKAWKELFQDSLYYDIEISREKLDSIVNSTQDDQQPYQKNWDLVEYLVLKYELHATDEELYALQKAFPNIKSIIFRFDSLRPCHDGTMADWNLWGLLKELDLIFGDSIMSNLENIVAKIVKCLPRLKRLDMHYFPDQSYSIPVSLNTFEILHSHLKHLGQLEFCLSLSTFPKTDFERIPELLPATEMRILKIKTKDTDYRWLYYFARKYPNLHALELYLEDTRNDDEERNDTKRQRYDAIELFKKAPRLFQHLTILDIHYQKCSDEEFLLFLDLIAFHDINLKLIKIDSWLYGAPSYSHICDFYKRTIAICLSRFSKTIETLVIRGTKQDMAVFDFVEIKDRLCNLVELEIESPTIFELDTLLCAAPRLKLLSLSNSDISVKNELYDSTRFGLESFKVELSMITSDVLRFLSFHCRSLNTLSLTYTIVQGDFTAPGYQLIDMSYTRLQYLTIKATVFIIQDNMISKDNWDLFLLTFELDDITPKQETDHEALPVVSGNTSRAPCRYWFHSHDSNGMYVLSESKGYRIERFVKSYERNKGVTIEKGIHKGRGRRSNHWNNRCMFGYTNLKIGYVAECDTKED